MKRHYLIAFTALLLAATTLPAAASDLNGFMPQAGEATFALSYTVEGYDEFYRGDTLVPAPPGLGEVETTSLTAWFRYGITDDFAISINAPYVDTEGDGTAGFEDSGLGDVTLLGHLRLAEWGGAARHSLTGAGGLRLESGYEGDAPVSLGDASNDMLIRLVYQVEAGNLYFSQQVGYDWRSGEVPDVLPLHTELGYTFGRTTVNLFYTNYNSDGGTDIGDPGFTFPSNEEDFERAGAKAYFRLGGTFGLTAAAYTTLDGRNTGDSTGVSVGGVYGF